MNWRKILTSYVWVNTKVQNKRDIIWLHRTGRSFITLSAAVLDMQRCTVHIHLHQLTLSIPLKYTTGEKVFFCCTEVHFIALVLQKWYSIQHTYYSKNWRKLKIFSYHIQSKSTQYTNTYGQEQFIFLLHILALYRHLHGDHSPLTSTGHYDRMQLFRDVVLCCCASGECHDFKFTVTLYKPFYLG